MANGYLRSFRIAGKAMALLVLAATAAAQPVIVGEFGNPERLQIEGVAAYATKDVRAALLADYDVILASHPSSPYAEYASMLANRCRDSFRHLGFAHARVDARFAQETGNTVLTVREGPRFRGGELKIAGARRVDATKLKALLQREGPLLKDPLEVSDRKEDDDAPMEIEGPLWRAGEPVSFSEAGSARREAFVTAALAELGFHAGKFRCELTPDEERGRADLTVVLLDEGQPALVDDVRVRGLEKNTHDAVLREIGWRKGGLITLSELRRMNQRLRDSGRFITHELRLQPPLGEQKTFRLELNVLEYPHVTPLGEPQSHVEKTLLKFHRWASDFDQRGQDIVLRTQNEEGRIEVIFSPEHGAVLSYLRLASEGGKASAEHTVAFTAGDIGYYIDGMDQYFSIHDSRKQIELSLRLGLSDDDEDRDEYPSKFNIGFGVKEREEGDPPVAFDLTFAPAFFLAMAHNHNAVCRIEEGILTIESKRDLLQVRAESGEPVKLALKGEDGEEIGNVTFERGALQRRLQHLRARAKRSRNAYDPRRPVSSAARFVMNDALLREIALLSGNPTPADEPVMKPEMRRVLSRLIDLDALRPLDQFATGAMKKNPDDEDDEFDMNWDAALWKDRKLGVAEQYARLLLPFSDVLFERQSWPWTLYRESCLMIAGDARHTGEEIERLVEAPDSGPLCLLVTAELVDLLSPDARRFVATAGMKRLTVADFRNEYRVLLNRDFVIGKTVYRLAEIVRELDEQDTAALGTLLLDDDKGKFAHATRRLRTERDFPLSDILPTVLDDLWQEVLAAKIKAALQHRAE